VSALLRSLHLTCFVILATGCDGSRAQMVDGRVHGTVAAGALRVAYGGAWSPAVVETTVDVDADGNFQVPDDAMSVVAFEDLNQDGAMTAWVDRAFFCAPVEGWRCEVAPERIVVRGLDDGDESTPAVEILFFTEPTEHAPAICFGEECAPVKRHPRHEFTYAQVCEAMRAATIVLPRDATSEAALSIPVSAGGDSMELGVEALTDDQAIVQISGEVLRARVWSEAVGAEPLDWTIGLAGSRILATAPTDACGTDCATWVHAARWTRQVRVGEVIVDYVDEIHRRIR